MITFIIESARALSARYGTEDGAVTIEYGVLVVFMALGLIAVVGVLTGGIQTWFQAISDFIGSQPADAS